MSLLGKFPRAAAQQDGPGVFRPSETEFQCSLYYCHQQTLFLANSLVKPSIFSKFCSSQCCGKKLLVFFCDIYHCNIYILLDSLQSLCGFSWFNQKQKGMIPSQILCTWNLSESVLDSTLPGLSLKFTTMLAFWGLQNTHI